MMMMLLMLHAQRVCVVLCVQYAVQYAHKFTNSHYTIATHPHTAISSALHTLIRDAVVWRFCATYVDFFRCVMLFFVFPPSIYSNSHSCIKMCVVVLRLIIITSSHLCSSQLSFAHSHLLSEFSLRSQCMA